MQTETSSSASVTTSRSLIAVISNPWIVLISRSAMFLFFQALIAVILAIFGASLAWDGSARWWLFTVILTNLVSIYLLVHLYAAEGKRYRDAIRFSRASLKGDLLWLLATALIGLPIAASPMYVLGNLIFGDRMTPIHIMFRPLPAWALAVGLLFPITVAFAELPTYFGYAMPRLAERLHNGWLAWLIASFFLGAQHMFLPFIPDARFMLWRLGMYMPFALFAGLLLKLRPTLLPYFMIIHALVDLSAVSVYLMI